MKIITAKVWLSMLLKRCSRPTSGSSFTSQWALVWLLCLTDHWQRAEGHKSVDKKFWFEAWENMQNITYEFLNICSKQVIVDTVRPLIVSKLGHTQEHNATYKNPLTIFSWSDNTIWNRLSPTSVSVPFENEEKPGAHFPFQKRGNTSL